MKKFIINIILLVILVVLCDVIFFTRFPKEEYQEDFSLYKYINIPSKLNIKDFVQYWNFEDKRNNVGLEYQKNNNGIILAGCSFAYSFGLDDNATLAKVLSEQTKRPVYVRAFPSFGPNENLYFLTKNEFYKNTPQSNYYIYLFIHNHFSRMFSRMLSLNSNVYRPFYDIDENFEIKERPFYSRPLFLSNIYKFFYRRKVTLNYGHVDEELLYKTLSAQNKLLQKNFSNGIKFIFINYNEGVRYNFSDEFMKKLKAENIMYVNADELVLGKDMQMTDEIYFQEDGHPSAYAYKLFGEKLGNLINNQK